jgi:hypothetical protein
MSRASFPRPEQIALLRERIAARLAACAIPLEVAERGLDHYRCCYRFGFRQSSGTDWRDLAIHFQLAERLEVSGDDAELGRLLDLFWERNFAAGKSDCGSNLAAAKE